MRHLIKKYWDLLGGTICGVGIALLANWKVDKIQLCYTVLLLVLVCIGILKVIKERTGGKRKEKQVVDKVIENQKAIEVVNLVNHPEEKGREIINVIVETKNGGTLIMAKIKKLWASFCKGMKWLWTYRQQVIGLLAAGIIAIFSVYGYILTWIDKAAVQFGSNLGWIATFQHWIVSYAENPARCLFANLLVIVVACVAVFYLVRNQVEWAGVGSLTTAKEYLDKVSSQAVSQTSDDVKKRLNAILKKYKPKLKEVKKALEKAKKEVESTKLALSNANSTNQLAGVVIEKVEPLQTAYNNAVATLNKANAEFNSINEVITHCETKLEQNTTVAK